MTFACKSKDDSATTFSEVGHNTSQDVDTSHFATGK